MHHWYKKSTLTNSNQYWLNNERYAWFTVGITWDSPRAVEDFQESQELRDMVEENCYLSSSRLERIGFPKQHSYLIFDDDISDDDRNTGLASSTNIKLKIKILYKESWDDLLVHEWAHRYFFNVSSDSKELFKQEYNRIMNSAFYKERNQELERILERVTPENIKKMFPDVETWKIRAEKILYKDEMKEVRDFLERNKYTITSYAATDEDELWSESVMNYSRLDPNLKKVIQQVIQRG